MTSIHINARLAVKSYLLVAVRDMFERDIQLSIRLLVIVFLHPTCEEEQI